MSTALHDELNGQRIVVVGGTGEVGEGIVRQLLAAGAEIVVPARSPDRRQTLLDRVGNHDRLTIVDHGFSTAAQADAFARHVGEGGPVLGVVASIGSFWGGPHLVDVPPGEWDRLIAASLTPHYAVARAFAPLLGQHASGVFVQLAGAAGLAPMRGSSLMCITAAGVLMLGRQLAAEQPHNRAPRFVQLRIDTLVKTRSQPEAGTYRITADDVGTTVGGLIAGRLTATDGPTFILA